MKYLIDTDIVSYFLRGEAKVVQKLSSLSNSSWCVSVITAYELERGSRLQPGNRKLADRVARFLRSVDVRELESEDVSAAARISTELSLNGASLPHLDVLIAGHAISLNATLVTNNTKHFERIDELKIESWFS